LARINIKHESPVRDFSGAMTDISFLLIIFFIISAVFITDRGILLQLPDPAAQPRTLTREEVVSISIAEPGHYTIDGAEVAAPDLRTILSQKITMFDEPIVVLSVGAEVKYQEVLSVLEEARYSGYSGYSIQTEIADPLGLRIEAE
jgi:biopolymer transport protein ExbD